ncbi:MAG: dUTP diphosphatase [Chlamydiia bacterium]|nr:dUTP diphosphatase [Chlamydiia bacterium]
MTQKISVRVVAKNPKLIPFYASHGAAGADVRAFLDEPVTISPGSCALIPTGLFFAIPEGYEIQVRPRSGLALKEQVTVLNTPGTIDSDYRGELCVILMNHGKKDFIVEPSMRVAQIIVAPVVQAEFTCVEELDETVRGANGFGHTGRH